MNRALSGVSVSRAVAFLTVLLAAVWLMAGAALAQTGPTFPPLNGRVVDRGDLISDVKEQALADRLAALERDTTDQVVVVTVPDLQG